jgi:aminoglycoside 2''-phosphotransferase
MTLVKGAIMIPREYSQQIRQAFPFLDLSNTVYNQDGLVNDVVIVDSKVFRFVKHDWGLPLLEQELKVLELLKDRLELPIPHPIRLSPTCVTYEYIPGEAFTHLVFQQQDASTQEHLIQQFALLLEQLHTTPLELVHDAGIGPSDTNRDRNVWLTLYADVQAKVHPHLMRHQRDYVDSVFAPIVENTLSLSYQARLVNGDFTPYHVLFDAKAKRLAGVIDFGTVGLGDPAVDVATSLYNYGEPFLERLFSYYPDLANYLERARFWAKTLELQWVLAAIRTNHPFWYVAHIGAV